MKIGPKETTSQTSFILLKCVHSKFHPRTKCIIMGLLEQKKNVLNIHIVCKRMC